MSRLCVDKQIRIFVVTKKSVENLPDGLIQACIQSVCGKLKGNASIQVKSPSNPQFGELLPHSFWAIIFPVTRVRKRIWPAHSAFWAAWTANKVVC
jgi:hypothetical protein